MYPTRILILSLLFIFGASSLFGAPSEKYDRLYRESSDFKAVEDALNDIWKKLRAELGKSEWKKLLDDQRRWLKTQERLLAEAKDSEIGPYLRETCDRALRLRDYYRSLSKSEPIVGGFAEGSDSFAAWRTSLKIGETECSRLYALKPPVKFANLTEAGRELANKNKAVAAIDFYDLSASLAKADLFKKQDESAARDSDPARADNAANSQEPAEKVAENRESATPAPGEKENEPKKEATEPSKNRHEAESDAKDSGDKQVVAKESEPEPSNMSEPKDKTGEKRINDPDRPPIAKEEASRILAGLSLRAKRNGDYLEYYVAASKKPCLIEGYVIDEGAVRSSEERAKRVYKPQKTRPGKPLYLFSLPVAEKISRVDIRTEAGDKSWILGEK